jgi:hypothetical protein
MLEGEGARNLAPLDHFCRCFEYPAVHRLKEMIRLQEFGNPFKGAIVGQDCAQQGGLDFDVLGQGAVGRARARIAVQAGDVVFGMFHGRGCTRLYGNSGAQFPRCPNLPE